MPLPNFYPGCSLVLICIIGYIFSFRCFKKDRYIPGVSMLVICGLLLRIYTSSDPFLHAWDERYHALVAKHLITNWLKPTLYSNPLLPYDFKNWTQNYIWLHKQPMSLWLIQLSLRLCGCSTFAVRLPSIILSTACILLTYDAGKQLYDKRTGFIAAFFFSIHGLIIALCSGRTATDHTDTIFLFFILLAIWAGIKQAKEKSFIYILLLGVSLGAAILTKWLPALIVLPVWWLQCFEKQKPGKIVLNSIVILLITALIVLPWQLYIHTAFPLEANWESAVNKEHFFEAIEGHSGSIFYYFDELRVRYGEFVYLPIAWFSFMALKNKRPKDLALLMWFWLPYLFFSFAATKMPAYTLIAAPAVFIITADVFFYLKDQYNRSSKWYIYILLYVLLLLPLHYSYEEINPFAKTEIPRWMKEIKSIQASPYNSNKYIILNCPHYVEMMFYTNCIAYDLRPAPDLVRAIRNKGYNVLVLK